MIAMAIVATLQFQATYEHQVIIDPTSSRRIELKRGKLFVGSQVIQLPEEKQQSWSYQRYVWLSKDELLLWLDDRFYRVGLKERVVRLSGTGLLAFVRQGSTGWVGLDQKTIFWRDNVTRIPMQGRVIGMSTNGRFVLVEADDECTYMIYDLGSEGFARPIASWRTFNSDELLAVFESVSERKFVVAPAAGRGEWRVREMKVTNGVPKMGARAMTMSSWQWLPTTINGRVYVEYLGDNMARPCLHIIRP